MKWTAKFYLTLFKLFADVTFIYVTNKFIYRLIFFFFTNFLLACRPTALNDRETTEIVPMAGPGTTVDAEEVEVEVVNEIEIGVTIEDENGHRSDQ